MKSQDTPPDLPLYNFRKLSQKTNPNILHIDQNSYTSAGEEQFGRRRDTKQNIQTNNPLMNKQTTAQIAKLIGKRFKYYVQAIRAAVRLKLLIKPKLEQWN